MFARFAMIRSSRSAHAILLKARRVSAGYPCLRVGLPQRNRARSFRFFAICCIVFCLSRSGAWAQEKAKPVEVTITGQIIESDAKDAVRLMPCKVHVLK